MPRKRNTDEERNKLDGRDALELSSKELLEFLTVAVSTPMEGEPGHKDCLWGLPTLVEGMPGLAKTARIKQLAVSLSTRLQIFFAAPHPPESFAGALIPDGHGDGKNIVALSELRSIIKLGAGILYMDELNGAAPATQGAIQSLIHERHTGGSNIPGEIRILSSQNPEEIATGGNSLAPAVANRFIHITDPGPTATEWTQWRIGNWSMGAQRSLDDLTSLVAAQWRNKFPVAQGLFAGFIDRMPGELYRMPDQGDPRSSKAWASHRTWDYATRAWATCLILDTSENVKQAMIEACVGVGGASMLQTYASAADIPSPEEVLNGKWVINTDRLDVVFAAYGAATAFTTQRPDAAERLNYAPQLWKAYMRLIDAGLADLCVPLSEQVIRAGLGVNSQDKPTMELATKVYVELKRRKLVQQKSEIA